MKTTHTPGPWKAEALKATGQINNSVILNCCDYICLIDAVEGKEKNDANARLIAAAPDLLNMLQRMVGETSGGFTPCLLTLEHARAAIAKATGGAS